MVESDEMKQAETAGGYAKEMSDDFKRKQATLVCRNNRQTRHCDYNRADPRTPCPVLVTEDMVKSIKQDQSSLIFTVEQGGNCTR